MADADILRVWNQALQILGTKSTITGLTEDSNEATNCSLAYATLRDWCLSMTNWNFARKTAVLTSLRSVSPATAPWTTAFPAPPWSVGYEYPADCIVARYVTDMTIADNQYAGKPARFAVAWDTLSAKRTILVNKTSALLIYTYQVTDPSLWPPFFQRLVSAQLALAIAPSLTGNMDVIKYVMGVAQLASDLAVEVNLREGLYIDDTTPEWIIARGIPYPQRRAQVEQPQRQPQQDTNRGN